MTVTELVAATAAAKVKTKTRETNTTIMPTTPRRISSLTY